MKNWKHPKTIVGDAAEGSHYFRRPKIEERIWREINKQNNVVFNAPRRTGKSSILKYMASSCPENYLCKYENISSDRTSQDFYKRFFGLVLTQINKKEKLKNKFSGWIESIGIESISLSGEINFKNRGQSINYKESLLQILPDMSSEKERIILFLDEFPDVISNIAKEESALAARDILQTLRKLTQESQFKNSIGLVLTGSIGLDHVIRKVDRSIVVNNFRRVNLPPLEKKQPYEFVKFLTENASMKLSNEVTKYLIQKLHQPIPYFIQLMIESANDIVQDHDQPDITIEIIDQAWMEVLGQHEHFQDWNDRLKTYCKEEYNFLMEVLKHAAHNPNISIQELFNYGEKNGHTHEFKALTDDILIKDGYLEESPENSFKFISPLLKEWWANRYPNLNTKK
uniref:hypothetical protein n=1 Tax=Roseivirga sp. TaxID=1964215 RepID=UPI004047D4C8